MSRAHRLPCLIIVTSVVQAKKRMKMMKLNKTVKYGKNGARTDMS